ncbi:MAG: hypothetical protein NVS9B12_12790 [Vulcanimicrobiaceae bacterium]
MENDTNGQNDNDIETEGTGTVFDDDGLDGALAAADATGMIAQQQTIISSEESEKLSG